MKTTFNIGKYTMFSGVMIWFLETVFFLIRDGWHIRPSCKLEETFDNISTFMILIGWAVMIYIIVRVYDKHFNA